MQLVLLGPKRVKLSEIEDYKSNWQHIQPKVNDQKEETLQEEKEISQMKDYKSNWDHFQPNVNDERAESAKEEKITELKYKNKTHIFVTNESTVVQKEQKFKTN